MKNKQYLGVILWFSILMFGLTACNSAGKETPTPVPTPITLEKPVYIVQRGTVTEVVQLTGRVMSVQQENLFFHSGGVVKEVLVEAGNFVERGMVLARLDEPEQYQATLAAKELAYIQAQRNLEQVTLDLPVKLVEAQRVLELAYDELEYAQTAVDAIGSPRVTNSLLLEEYHTKFVISEQYLKTAHNRYDALSGRPETDLERYNALSALIEAQKAHYRASINLSWANGELTQAQIDQLQIDLVIAQANYDKAGAELVLWDIDNPMGELAVAELVLAEAEARFTMAQKALEAVELRAPFSGQILSLGIAPGSSVDAFQTVISLADPTSLEIRAIPNNDDLLKFGLGQTAVVRFSSQPGQELAAEITNVPMLSDFETGLDNNVHLQLEDPNISLTLNEAVVILITIDQQKDVLWLPPAALRSFQGETFVYVEIGEVQRRVNVIIGLESNDRMEIVSGLEEGQIVIGQ